MGNSKLTIVVEDAGAGYEIKTNPPEVMKMCRYSIERQYREARPCLPTLSSLNMGPGVYGRSRGL
jgi:hypothetical protein